MQLREISLSDFPFSFYLSENVQDQKP